MTYLSGRVNKRKVYILYTLFGVVFLILIFLWPSTKKYFYGVVEPAVLWYGSTKQSLLVFPEFFVTYVTTHKTLASRNKELEVEIERLENNLADYSAIMREQGIKTDSTSSFTQFQDNTIVMYPLMQDITKLYSTVILSKGFKDGITTGSIVYLRGNQAVCTIKEVYPSSSLCALLSASGIATEGVTSSSSIAVTLLGRGGHFLANVPRDTPLTVGEIIYLRSNPNMVLGTVRQVMNNSQDTSWHVFVDGAYNPLTSSIFYVQP